MNQDLPFLAPQRWRDQIFIGGWRAAAQRIDIIEPATGDILDTTGRADVAHVA